MYMKYNYSPSGGFYNSVINPNLSFGRDYYDKEKYEVELCIEKFLDENGTIDGSKIKDHWFKITNKDVFISHSHKDLQKAIAFAGWLKKEFDVDSFIDSCIWGYCDDFLRKIDDKYCYQPKNKTYNYKSRNYTTSHVHMMLSTALTEMIDNTECIIFFNTPNSIVLKDEIDSVKRKTATMSPWIYHELSMTTMLRINEPQRNELAHSELFGRGDPNVEYDVGKAINELILLKDEDLKRWNSDYKSLPVPGVKNPLDVLYEITNIK